MPKELAEPYQRNMAQSLTGAMKYGILASLLVTGLIQCKRLF